MEPGSYRRKQFNPTSTKWDVPSTTVFIVLLLVSYDVSGRHMFRVGHGKMLDYKVSVVELL